MRYFFAVIYLSTFLGPHPRVVPVLLLGICEMQPTKMKRGNFTLRLLAIILRQTGKCPAYKERTSAMSPQIPATLIALCLLSTSAVAEDLKLPIQPFKCEEDYIWMSSVCVSKSAFLKMDQADLFELRADFSWKNWDEMGVVCEVSVEDTDGDFLKLSNGARVKASSRRFRDDASFLFGRMSSWKLWTAKGEVIEVDLLNVPDSCRQPTTYAVTANDFEGSGSIVLNGTRRFDIVNHCNLPSPGVEVVFLDRYSGTILELPRLKICEIRRK